jgi:hypothetical protein
MSNTKIRDQIIGLALFAMLLAGCGGVGIGSTGAPTDMPLPTNTPTPKPIPTYTPSPAYGLHSICLNVDQDLPQDPIYRAIWRILTGLDLQVADSESGCDAKLNIDLAYEAIGKSYKNQDSSGNSYCYTGGEIQGRMTLSIPGNAQWEHPISRKKNPTSGIIYRCPKSDEVDFNGFWPEPILDGLALLWGPDVYVQALNVWVEEVQAAAANSLEEMGTEEIKGATPALLLYSLLRGASYSYSDMPEDISSLIQILEENGENWERRVTAAWRLASKDEKTATPTLIQILEDDNVQVRIAAAWALGKIWHLQEEEPPDGVIPALMKALEDQEPWVRETAAWSLGQLWGGAGVIPALTQAIGDPNLSVRETAIRAIPPSRLHNTRVDDSVAADLAHVLSQAIEDEAFRECRYPVLMNLEALGPQAMKAVPALINHLQVLDGKGLDLTDAEYRLTWEALIEITEQRFMDTAAWQEWWEQQQ